MSSEWAILGYGFLGGLAALFLPRFILCIFGFTCCGVRKSSYASGWQSSLGEVEAGSGFSHLQSTGAGGTPCGIKCGLFLFGCYFTIVLIVMNEYWNLEPSSNYNYTTDSPSSDFTLAPNNLTDFVTVTTTNLTDFITAATTNLTDFITLA